MEKLMDLNEYLKEATKNKLHWTEIEKIRAAKIKQEKSEWKFKLCPHSKVKYVERVDYETTYLVQATEEMLKDFPIVWMKTGGYINWKGSMIRCNKKLFKTKKDMIAFVKSIGRPIICDAPHWPNNHLANGTVIPVYNSKPKKEYKKTRYWLSYYDVGT